MEGIWRILRGTVGHGGDLEDMEGNSRTWRGSGGYGGYQ
jgi:hypothetical protein